MATVNPLLPQITAAGFGGYWFGIDQAELATDPLFKSRDDLERTITISSTPPLLASAEPM